LPALLAIGCLAQVAQFCFLRAHQITEARVLAPLGYLMIVLSTLADYLLFGVVPTLSLVLGATLIVGTALVAHVKDGARNFKTLRAPCFRAPRVPFSAARALATPLPWRRSMRTSAAVRPSSRRGWWIVVRDGSTMAANSMSSKPATATSPGTRMPDETRARMSPIAISSLEQNIAVGRVLHPATLCPAAAPASSV
jgi:hypothetical protein